MTKYQFSDVTEPEPEFLIKYWIDHERKQSVLANHADRPLKRSGPDPIQTGSPSDDRA